MIRSTLLLVLLSLLSACGFQLRGDYRLPAELSKIYISTRDENSELVRDLRRVLKNSVELVNQADLATAVLKIEKESQKQRVLSVSGGQAREYEIRYEVEFSVDGKGNAYQLTTQKISLNRDYIFDTTAVLGKSREQASLIRDMQRDAARLIMLKLQANKSSVTSLELKK